jgi:hypothetical protein
MSTTQTLLQILLHTPPWVFLVFGLLVVLGASQCVRRQAGLARLALAPLGMLAWSFSSAIAASAAAAGALGVWLLATALAAAAVARHPAPAGTRHDAATRRFNIPGSPWPLVLMMGIFFTKYAAGVALALRPGLAAEAARALPLAAVYGVLGGALLGRALRLARLWWAARSGPMAVAPAAA